MDMEQQQPHNKSFNCDFYMQIAQNVGLKVAQRCSNFVFSPLSIHLALSMVAVGYKGRTLEQMLTFLIKSHSVDDLNSLCSRLLGLMSADEGPRLAFSNGVWVQKSYSLKRSFKETLNIIYLKWTVPMYKVKEDENGNILSERTSENEEDGNGGLSENGEDGNGGPQFVVKNCDM